MSITGGDHPGFLRSQSLLDPKKNPAGTTATMAKAATEACMPAAFPPKKK
ncbi:MAG: hypothetical protein ACI835_002884 [Planctomycetota bacterium]|jgi:hypothetical protein